MKMEKIKLYKLFWFCKNPLTGVGKYLPISGLWYSIEDFFVFLDYHVPSSKLFVSHLRNCSIIKIPFFGYHSQQFTALDPRGIAVNEKAEV